ncbi:BON domain-containing protein [Bowmanella pacifica]|uniref:BON domain-containing protein n=3 Tax=Bowmanella TaxID=366580 RepID=A0A918DIP5_9ALTE|nr:BON domain-containing protein [Bowmanella pacifica]GGO68913.1 BON domain-containing protein [Bowmanella pacifica]
MMKMTKGYLVATLLLATTQLTGCAVAIVGAGVGAASVAHDRRTVGTQLDDATLASRISSKLSTNEQLKGQAHINVEVFNGVALLVGQVPNEQLKREAQRLAESLPQVTRLHNQLRLGSPTQASVRTHDVWLATKVKSNLVADKRVDGLHIEVIVEDSEVFLMGLVNQQEANIAVDIVRNINGVVKVIKAFEYL